MKRNLLLILIFLITYNYLLSREISGITMPEYLKMDNQTLVLNGCGVIKKFLFKVYAVGLYLESKTSDWNKLLYEDKPFIIRLHFLRNGISDEQIIDAWNTGFNKNTDVKASTIQNEINSFNALFKGITVNENNIFQFDYMPGVGTRVYINGQLKGNIGGYYFKRALIGIWIGKEPRDDGVKDKLLGK
mgnify:CR=1 FL=1